MLYIPVPVTANGNGRQTLFRLNLVIIYPLLYVMFTPTSPVLRFGGTTFDDQVRPLVRFSDGRRSDSPSLAVSDLKFPEESRLVCTQVTFPARGFMGCRGFNMCLSFSMAGSKAGSKGGVVVL